MSSTLLRAVLRRRNRAQAQLDAMRADLHSLADELHSALDDRDCEGLRRAVDDHVRMLRVIAALADT